MLTSLDWTGGPNNVQSWNRDWRCFREINKVRLTWEKKTHLENVHEIMWRVWGKRCLAASLCRLLKIRARVSQQYNPIHCPVYVASFCNTATLAILLSSHYFWQCKWLIPLKTALCGQQNPGIIWVKSRAFRLQPCSVGPRSPSSRTSQSRGEISHPHLMTVIFGDLLWINSNLQQFFMSQTPSTNRLAITAEAMKMWDLKLVWSPSSAGIQYFICWLYISS